LSLLAALAVALPLAATPRPAPAQPPSGGDAAKAVPAATASLGEPATGGLAVNLATRFRFIEPYARDPAKPAPGEVGPYRVASREVIRIMAEKPQGTPERKETTVQVIYTERPAAVSSSGGVTDSVRRYETLRISPTPAETKPSTPKPLEGLTVWYKTRSNASALIMALTPDHPLSETEFAINSKVLYLPDVAGVLPSLPSRIGDRWRVPRSAAAALLGERPLPGDSLVGTLLNVRQAPAGPDYIALIGVTGRASLPPRGAETRLNAQVVFTFSPPRAAAADAAGSASGAVDARGAITDVRLARMSTAALPNSNGRLRNSFTWELTLQRQLSPPGEPLALPATPPVATEANSWLTYDDPRGRFHFRHPQDLIPRRDPELDQDNTVQLLDEKAGVAVGRVLTIQLQAKTGNPEADKKTRDPDTHSKELTEEWARNRQDVLPGPKGWLPEADWSPSKMKVFRIEAALKTEGPTSKTFPRIYLDHYLVLFSQNESLKVDAMTPQDPPLPFRNQVEEILKTFRLKPSSRTEG